MCHQAVARALAAAPLRRRRERYKETFYMHADVLRAINTQINSEFTAWYQYLAMAAFCDREKFTGAAKWLRIQSVEEYQHGVKLFDFVLARNGAVKLEPIEQPTLEFDTFGDVFERALEQEERVTAQ